MLGNNTETEAWFSNTLKILLLGLHGGCDIEELWQEMQVSLLQDFSLAYIKSYRWNIDEVTVILCKHNRSDIGRMLLRCYVIFQDDSNDTYYMYSVINNF